ncbi:MAG TPA: TolC family protein [Dissulfurispiraceae bacterium]|nr:TolC family protein [Dissulfurispiraceae bacterium]
MPSNREEKPAKAVGSALLLAVFCLSLAAFFSTQAAEVFAYELTLQGLIDEALNNNPELQASMYRASGAEYRIPQVKSLPDPLLSFGYQNEGFSRYSYGQSEDSQWIFSASQTIPFPGKLALKGEAAGHESESLRANYEALRLKTISKVKELYFDLYATYKTADLVGERNRLFSRVEEAALSLYASGKGSQQDVLLAQTEKYLLVEKEALLRQKIQSLDAQLCGAIGRTSDLPLGRPAETSPSSFAYTTDELIRIAEDRSPELKAKDGTIKSSEARLSFAKKDYIPDFTVTGGYIARGNGFGDMWSLTTSINVPIFYRTKQRHAVNEANASLMEASSDRAATRLAIISFVRDNYSLLKSSDKLMSLYRDGLIPKSRQDVELALSGYRTGSVDAFTVISKLKSVIDFEISYWGQFAEHEKAIARIEAATGLGSAYFSDSLGAGHE